MASHLIFKTSRSVIGAVGRRTRRRRMEQLKALMGLGPELRILDLGGRPEKWESVPEKLDITILNLPGETGSGVPTHHDIKFVDGDACDARQFPDQSFDLVFSNSVIEHVGPERQAAFARELQRLAPSYWVQTPSKWFPIEAHTGMPLWWLYPEAARQFFLERWRSHLEKWANSMADTRVLTREQLQASLSREQRLRRSARRHFQVVRSLLPLSLREQRSLTACANAHAPRRGSSLFRE